MLAGKTFSHQLRHLLVLCYRFECGLRSGRYNSLNHQGPQCKEGNILQVFIQRKVESHLSGPRVCGHIGLYGPVATVQI